MKSLVCKKRYCHGERYDIAISGAGCFIFHYVLLRDGYKLGYVSKDNDKRFTKDIGEICTISPELGLLFVRNMDKISFISDSGPILIGSEDFKEYFLKEMDIDELSSI